MSRLARFSLLTLAVLACVWFAFGIRQSRDTARATALVNRTSALPAEDVARARSLISSAGALNPDLTVDVLRGQLDIDLNHNAAAERTLLGVVRSEPLNIAAWVQLAVASTQNGDHRTFNRAVQTIDKLEPKVK